MLTMVATASASTMDGRIHGSVDGKTIDVPAHCETADISGNVWLQAGSDPPLRGGAVDRNGDGVAVSVSGVTAQRRFAFTVVVGGDSYNFGGSGVTVTPSGIRMATTIHRYQRGSHTPVSSYQVDLTVICQPR
jgi:hypothetical protein